MNTVLSRLTALLAVCIGIATSSFANGLDNGPEVEISQRGSFADVHVDTQRSDLRNLALLTNLKPKSIAVETIPPVENIAIKAKDPFYIAPKKDAYNYNAEYTSYFDGTIRVVGGVSETLENTCTTRWRCLNPGTTRIAVIPVRVKVRLKDNEVYARGKRTQGQDLYVQILPYLELTRKENGRLSKGLYYFRVSHEFNAPDTRFRRTSRNSSGFVLSGDTNYELDWKSETDLALIVRLDSGKRFETTNVEDAAVKIVSVKRCDESKAMRKTCAELKR